MGMNPLAQNVQVAGLPDVDKLAGNAMYPQSQMDKTQYAVSNQMPTSAEVVASDYDAETDPYTGMPNKPFKKGGLSAIPRYNGEDNSNVKAWDPASGNVKLQKLSDPSNPFSDVTTIDYTVPKDSIKQFIPSIDPETNASTGAGQYILKDGSTMNIDANGIVQSATPARNEYTLNDKGYYQPTGPGLTWRGDQNMLTKTIGGVEVNVPGIYTKGGYQDAKGNLRTDANGVPIALPPPQYDSGAGKSGLADAAPYITALALGGAGLAITPELLAAEGLTTADILGSTFTGSQFAIDPAAAYAAAGAGAGEVAAGGAGAGGGGAATAGEVATQGNVARDAFNAYRYANLARNVLGMASGSLGGGGGSTYGAAAQNIPYQSFNPGVNPSSLANINAYNRTPWTGVEPSITLSKLSDFAPRELAAGGPTSIGHLGSYSDGGRLLKGPGDGMSDNIPATIANKQPARLADGEFVVPADVVSHLGNGSTDAGAKKLYAMMDRVRKARTGNKKQGKQINPDKFLPKG